MAELPPLPGGIVVNYFIVSDDVERPARFYTEVLGGRVVFSPVPTVVELSNTFIVINAGGGPTDDKPEVTLETPRDPGWASSFVNIRVKDIEAAYAAWSARGAQFLTPPKQHPYETRCYIRDPDGHLIEVGQTTDPKGTGCRLAGHRVRPPGSLDHRATTTSAFVTAGASATPGKVRRHCPGRSGPTISSMATQVKFASDRVLAQPVCYS